MKILVAVDGSECGNAAVATIANRPWPNDTEFRLLAVTELHLLPQPGSWLVPDSHYLNLLNQMQEQARQTLARGTEVLQSANPAWTVTSEILNGVAKEVIIQEAGSWNADLIVVGSHGHGAVMRFLLGSVSMAVAAHAPCSVEIIRQSGK